MCPQILYSRAKPSSPRCLFRFPCCYFGALLSPGGVDLGRGFTQQQVPGAKPFPGEPRADLARGTCAWRGGTIRRNNIMVKGLNLGFNVGS